jgi:hypothetical protein
LLKKQELRRLPKRLHLAKQRRRLSRTPDQ